MGGGHRIRPLLLAYVICSPTLTGQSTLGGMFNSEKGWGCDGRAALSFLEAVTGISLAFFFLSPRPLFLVFHLLGL